MLKNPKIVTEGENYHLIRDENKYYIAYMIPENSPYYKNFEVFSSLHNLEIYSHNLWDIIKLEEFNLTDEELELWNSYIFYMCNLIKLISLPQEIREREFSSYFVRLYEMIKNLEIQLKPLKKDEVNCLITIFLNKEYITKDKNWYLYFNTDLKSWTYDLELIVKKVEQIHQDYYV